MQTRMTPALAGVTLAFLFLVGVVLHPRPAIGADKVWGFKGTVSSYVSGTGYASLPDAPVGSVVRGQFRFDDTEADTNGASDAGSYPFIVLVVAIEGTSLIHLAGTLTGTIDTEDNVVVGPAFRDSLGVTLGSTLLFPDLDYNVFGLELDLTEVASPAPTVMTSDALPASPPALVDFTTLQNLNVIGYTNSFADFADMNVAISEFEEPGTVDLPLIPDSSTVNPDGSVTWTFTTSGISLCVSGCWIDPPVSTAFTYSMTNAALFTDIADFPSGFASTFDVSVDGSSLGSFGPGDAVDFSGFPGGGVSEFVVSGIDPGADLSTAEAFPLELVFDSASAEFTMTSESPASVPGLGLPGMLLVVGLLIGSALAARRVRAFA